MGLVMACFYGGVWGIPTGLIKSTKHPSSAAAYLLKRDSRYGPCSVGG